MIAYYISNYTTYIYVFTFQGMGYGRELLNFAESTRPKSQVYVVSCRTDNLPLYEKRGYKEISRCPAESIIPPETLTRDGLEMIKLQKI